MNPAGERGNRITHLAWSFTERVLPRVASAVLMILLARLLAPELLGLYAWAILAATFFQAVTESAVRQIAALSVVSAAGRAFLRRYALWAGIGGFTFILAALAVLWAVSTGGDRLQVALLLPMALAPAVNALAIQPTARLQVGARWRQLAAAQLVAAAVVLPLTVVVLLLTRSLLAPALQFVLTELAVLAWAIWQARRVAVSDRVGYDVGARQFAGLMVYGAIGWGQSQLDRVFVGALAGVRTLGFFSTTVGLGRTTGDALAAATTNVYRAGLANSNTPEERTATTRNTLSVAIALAFASVAAVYLGTRFIIVPFLGPEWQAALHAVPVLALTALSSVVTYATTSALVAERQQWRLVPIRVVGLALSLLVALAATQSLVAAAWVVVARDVVVMTAMLVVARRLIPLPVVLLAYAGIAVGAGTIFALWW